MKTIGAIMKILTALATIAGAIYIVATYGDKIVAWAKEMLEKLPFTVECKIETAPESAPTEEAAVAEEAAPAEEAVEAAPAEEAVEATPAEEAAPEATEAPVADEADFEA